MKAKLLGTALIFLVSAGPAYPQACNSEKCMIQNLTADMIMLQQTVRQLQDLIQRNNDLTKSLLERTADKVNVIESMLPKISQGVDNSGKQYESSIQALRKEVSSVAGAIKELQQSTFDTQGQLRDIRREITNLKTQSTALPSADELWRTATSDFAAGNWNLVISGLQEFLQTYPDEPRAPDANIRIGEALLAQKKPDAAVTYFDIVLQKYPNSDKTSAALLKKGFAQAEINPTEAIRTLNEVAKRFPNTPESSSASQRLKELQPAGQRGRTPGAK